MPYVKAAEWKRVQKLLNQPPQSISPYFDVLLGTWRPDPDLVNRVCESMETRPIEDVLDAVLKTPIAYSQYYGAQGWVAVDSTVRLTTLPLAEEIIKDTPVEILEWIAERQDCDDISEIFESICRLFYGVNVRRVLSFSSGHAFIGWPLLVPEVHHHDDSDRATSGNGTVEWRFLEPQTDQWKTDLHIGTERKSGNVSQALIV